MASTHSNYGRLGIVGTLVIAFVVIAALNGSAISRLFGGDTYQADFAEAGGLVSGDDVIVSGVVVGQVTGVELIGDRVRVSFIFEQEVDGLGDDSRAEIMSRTALGKKALLIVPEGPGTLEADEVIPTERTVPPYDVTEALSELTATIQPIDTDQLSSSFDTVAKVLRQAAPEVRPALTGLDRLSRTLSSRDEELTRLLDSSASVSTLLAHRDQEVQVLFADGASLLSTLNGQSKALDALFENVRAMAAQVRGLVADNEDQIGPALKEINDLLRILRRNRDNIDHALESAGPLMRELGEVVAAFPGFNVYIPNLLMTNLVPVVPNLLLEGQR